MQKIRMATPGPTSVPSEILLASARDSIHHRSPQMAALMQRINASLPRFFGTNSDVYTVLSSGTGVMEAAVVNCFRPGEKVVVANNGYFGQRFSEIARIHGLEVVEVKAPWGQPISGKAVLDAATGEGVSGVLVVYSETSTGVVNPVDQIGRGLRDTEVVVVVDAISGLLSHKVSMDDWSLDVVLAASHKAFMMPPGLAFVAVSAKAWSKVHNVDPQSFYFCFRRLREFFPLAPSSPAVSLLLGLEKALELLEAEGNERVTRRHAALAEACQAGLEAQGFTLFVEDAGARSNTVTAVLAPAGVNTERVLDELERRFGWTVTGGQGAYKGRMLRIGHVGAFDKVDLIGLLGCMDLVLRDCGHTVDQTNWLTRLHQVFESHREVLG